MRLKCTSHQLARAAIVGTALLVIGLFALMAHNFSSKTSHRLRSHDSNADSHTVSMLLHDVKYSELRAAVTELYFASYPDTTDLDAQFEDALSAMKLVEEDGVPVPIPGVDGLYVGSAGKDERSYGRCAVGRSIDRSFDHVR